jgi:hypothetical protein
MLAVLLLITCFVWASAKQSSFTASLVSLRLEGKAYLHGSGHRGGLQEGRMPAGTMDSSTCRQSSKTSKVRVGTMSRYVRWKLAGQLASNSQECTTSKASNVLVLLQHTRCRLLRVSSAW